MLFSFGFLGLEISHQKYWSIEVNLSASAGPPWFFLKGLKWPPALVHPEIDSEETMMKLILLHLVFLGDEF